MLSISHDMEIRYTFKDVDQNYIKLKKDCYGLFYTVL